MSGAAGTPSGSPGAPALKSPPVKVRGLLRLVPNSVDERAFLPAALEIVETPASPVGRAIGGAIIAAAVAAVVWASLSKIDIIATAPGRIIPEGQTKIVQPFQSGVVQAIDVADGDHVTAGQSLIVLDPTSANADAKRISQDLLELELDRSRLEGLRAILSAPTQASTGVQTTASSNSGRTQTFEPTLSNNSNTKIAPVLQDVPANATQEEIEAANTQMQAQALEQAGKIANIDQQIQEKLSEAQQAVATIAKVQTDKPYLAQVAGMRTDLLHAQVGSKLDWLNAEEQLADTGPQIAQAEAQKQAALASVAALQQQRAETQAEYATGILKDLEQTEQKIGESTQDLVKAQQALELTTLRAPISGTVQQLMVHTVGGVVTPAQSLLTIIPDGGQLIVEASIQNQDIGFVRVGQEAQIKIAAFDFTRYGSIKGKIISISHDVVDQTPYQAPQVDGYTPNNVLSTSQQAQSNGNVGAAQSQAPEYVAHILLSKSQIETTQGPTQLEPGMAVTADVKTGRRRVISYLLSPFIGTFNQAGRTR